MNKPDSQQRIRQVAVVLTTVDEATARRLLGQFPASQARLIRQQMLRLGNVSPREREEAMRIFQQISGGAAPSTAKSEAASSNRSASNFNDNLSPAEAALLQQGDYQDRLEVSQNYSNASASQPFQASQGGYPSHGVHSPSDDSFQPVGHGNDPFGHLPAYPVWQNYTGEQLAQMLAGERPIVIAAVVQQAPTALGSSILQAMPVPLASATLAALPQLQTTDPTILQDIYSLLHERLAEFHRQSSPDNQGMMKLSALLTTIPHEYRKRVEESLATTQPLLAHSLGISRTELMASKENLGEKPSESGSPVTSVQASVPASNDGSTNSRAFAADIILGNPLQTRLSKKILLIESNLNTSLTCLCLILHRYSSRRNLRPSLSPWQLLRSER